MPQSTQQNGAGVNTGHFHLLYISAIIVGHNLPLKSTNSVIKHKELTEFVYTEVIHIHQFDMFYCGNRFRKRAAIFLLDQTEDLEIVNPLGDEMCEEIQWTRVNLCCCVFVISPL